MRSILRAPSLQAVTSYTEKERGRQRERERCGCEEYMDVDGDLCINRKAISK